MNEMSPSQQVCKKSTLHRFWSGSNKPCTFEALGYALMSLTSVSAYMRDVLHWIPVSQRILYRISALVWRSVTGCAPSYLTELCRPVSDLASRRALRSSARGELLVPRARSALKQRRAFSVIGPSTWNELPLTLRLLP